MMNHFLEISALSHQDAIALIKRAIWFKTARSFPAYTDHPVALLFYENSTRTRVSFELAAKHLSMPVVMLDKDTSSESKGETIEDTVSTLAAMGIKMAVIRHGSPGLPTHLSEKNVLQIINAGDGTQAHPSQALLDLMTIYEKKPALNTLKIAIIGDIRHSRVAHSLSEGYALFEVQEVVWVAPLLWQPDNVLYGRVTTSLKEGLVDADVVVCLRVQQERLLKGEDLDLVCFRQEYALTKKTLAYAKRNALVMHPGPMNREVEIDSDVADGPQSVILQQVTNGVFMRMALLEFLIKGSATFV